MEARRLELLEEQKERRMEDEVDEDFDEEEDIEDVLQAEFEVSCIIREYTTVTTLNFAPERESLIQR